MPTKNHRYKVDVEVSFMGELLIVAPSKKEAQEMADTIINKCETPTWYTHATSSVTSITKDTEDASTLCAVCGKYPITVKDYRTDDWGNSQSYYSCKYCFSLNNSWHDKVRIDMLDPKKVLEDE